MKLNHSKKNWLSPVYRFFSPFKSISFWDSHFRLIKVQRPGRPGPRRGARAAVRRTREREGAGRRVLPLVSLWHGAAAGRWSEQIKSVGHLWLLGKGNPQCKYCLGLLGTWAIKLDHLISIKLVLFHTYFIFLATSHNKPFLYYGETWELETPDHRNADVEPNGDWRSDYRLNPVKSILDL